MPATANMRPASWAPIGTICSGDSRPVVTNRPKTHAQLGFGKLRRHGCRCCEVADAASIRGFQLLELSLHTRTLAASATGKAMFSRRVLFAGVLIAAVGTPYLLLDK